ncbi:MAG: hypothetical protein EOO02_23900, partial [Chitinophagaceae bacterium]
MSQQHFTILYEQSAVSTGRIELYNQLLSPSGVTLSWVVYDANTHSLHHDQLVADAVLVTGKEKADEINVANLSLLRQGSRRLVAVFPFTPGSAS